MARSMPSQDLSQALSRLDHAISSAEAALDGADKRARSSRKQRDTAITEALSEIDDLFAIVTPRQQPPRQQQDNIHG